MSISVGNYHNVYIAIRTLFPSGIGTKHPSLYHWPSSKIVAYLLCQFLIHFSCKDTKYFPYIKQKLLQPTSISLKKA